MKIKTKKIAWSLFILTKTYNLQNKIRAVEIIYNSQNNRSLEKLGK